MLQLIGVLCAVCTVLAPVVAAPQDSLGDDFALKRFGLDQANHASSLLTTIALAQDPQTVVIDGKPPLTRHMLTRFGNFMEWLVEAPLMAGQRTQLEAIVVEAWQKHSQTDIDGTVEILGVEAQIAGMAEDQRPLVRLKIQPELLKAFHQDPNSPFCKLLLGVYDAAHVPIAGGKPPLTRQMSDSMAEMVTFMLSEASGQTCSADRQFKNDWARWMAKAYPAQAEARQAQWAESPVIWASLRIIWAHADEGERSRLRKEWADVVKDMFPQVKERAAAEAGMKDLNRLTELRKQRNLTPDELDRAAKDMVEVAKLLHKAGGDTAADQAAALEQAATAVRKLAADERLAAKRAAQGAAQAKSKTTATGRAKVGELMAASARSHEAYMSTMNMSMAAHYSRVNNINTLGGSPYRYVNAYGRPY